MSIKKQILYANFQCCLFNIDILTDVRYKDAKPKTRDNTHTSTIIYMINPFSSLGANSTNQSAPLNKSRKSSSSSGGGLGCSEESACTLALIMCYQELLDTLPEATRRQTYLHLIPLSSVLSSSASSQPDQQVSRHLRLVRLVRLVGHS